MKIPQLNLGEAALVQWVDSKSISGWSYDPKRKRTPGRIFTIGYVVQHNEECLTITTSMDERGASLDDFSIPVGCIKKITVLPDEFHLVKTKVEDVCTKTGTSSATVSY